MPTAAGEWTMRVCSYTWVVEGEIRNADNRTFSFGLNQMSTGSFRIPLNHPRAATLLQGDCLVQVFQNKVLRFNAEVVTCEEVADGSGKPTLAVTIADAAYWRLTHRLIGKSGDGWSWNTGKTAIAQLMLLSLNTDGDCGVRDGSYTFAGSVAVGPWRFVTFIEALLTLSRTLDGFDFRFDHYHPTADMGGGILPVAGVGLAALDCAPVLGTTKPNTIFEYGTGRRNIKNYKRQVSRAGLLTRGYSLPPGFPESVDVVVSAQSLSATTARGIHEALVTSDITTGAARQELVREHVSVRKQARQLITFTPTAYGHNFGTDYAIGDVVVARAKVGGATRFNANFRVYGVNVKLDAEGLPDYELTLVNDT